MKVEEVIQLNAETSVFLRETINLGLKYKITRFLTQLGEITKPALTERDNLIKRLSADGQEIKAKLEDGTDNPALEEFKKEYQLILNVEETIDCPEIEPSVLEKVTSNNNYPLLYKYLVIPEA